MKKIKKGFSLAEVLLASIIAAIIATIGFSLAKKGIENAYNLYIYTGYNAMSIAINDAVSKDLSINDWNQNEECNFLTHVANLLDLKTEGMPNPGVFTYKAQNGIKYCIYRHGTFYLENEDKSSEPNHYEYRIVMTVPSVKTKTSSTKSICMSYQPDRYKEMLIPFGWDDNDEYCKSDDMIKDIASRKDLLAFYFDDGWRGKVIKDDPESEEEKATYHRRYFRSADEIFCKLYKGEVKSVEGKNSIYDQNTCTTANTRVNKPDHKWQKFENDATKDTIIIRVADPRRA